MVKSDLLSISTSNDKSFDLGKLSVREDIKNFVGYEIKSWVSY